MRKTLLYIIGVTALAACSDDAESPYLDGKDKSPIAVVTNLSVNTATTRAVDKEFQGGESLITQLQTIKDGETTEEYWKMEYFSINSNPAHSEVDANTNKTSDLTCISFSSIDGKVYWDDYSSTRYDLREKNASDQLIRGIRLYYGLCYNGGSPVEDPTATALENGTLKWGVQKDQKASGIKTSDLLFAKTQESIKYTHEKTALPTLVLPFTHAMSKITIEIRCGDGFKPNLNTTFGSTEVKLLGVNTQCDVKAPTATLSDWTSTLATNEGLTMQKGDENEGNLICAFSAMIAPTLLKESDDIFATIANLGGNNYDIKLTDAILTTPADADDKAWSTKLAAPTATSVTPDAESGYVKVGDTSADKGGITLPGVNYKLIVTVNKQAISIEARITDWEEVTAETTGKINFAKDVTTISVSDGKKEAFTQNFDLYLKTENATSYGEKTTSATRENDVWTYSPGYAYWPQDNMPLYFRALSGAGATDPLQLATNNDLLWGTTDAHSGKYVDGTNYDYAESAAIDPRTKDIPLIFYHTMSKVKFVLQNDKDALAAEKVNLEGASIQLTNLYGSATLDLHAGTISESGHTMKTNLFDEQVSTTYSDEKASTEELYLVPQEITNDSRIVITLADGTKYSAQLNLCKVDTSSIDKHAVDEVVDAWHRNVSYIYTITLGKEEILFRALIREWDQTTASGTATMEWDD